MGEDLTRAETHFAFGQNWAEYAGKITEAEIAEAEKGLRRLLGEDLNGVRFLDIGCGSGLHALAAMRMGAGEVVALDVDRDAVMTTRTLLERHVSQCDWRVEEKSVFDLTSESFGRFDVVYSWGVLHHTGDMERALRQATALVANDGRLALALYRRIWMDWFWRLEKRWYAHASKGAQRRARAFYRALCRTGLAATGRRLSEYMANYKSNRGMNFDNDAHDWLGGWPYESISPPEVDALMAALEFKPERIIARGGWLFGRNTGFLGSGCDEYVYRRA